MTGARLISDTLPTRTFEPDNEGRPIGLRTVAATTGDDGMPDGPAHGAW
jgi:hypothetical protein